MEHISERLIVPLDVDSLQEARWLLRELSGLVTFFKIGSRLFTAEGSRSIEMVKSCGARVFLDLKYHDIPSVIGAAVARACEHGVDLLTLHTLGGMTMMEEVVERTREYKRQFGMAPWIVGVTILTSHGPSYLSDLFGIEEGNVEEQVIRLAVMAQTAGLDGVVSSPAEVETIKQACGDGFLCVTPGVRPAGSARGDQKRTFTPGDAIHAGADYLVVGRPILKAPDRRAAAAQIITEMEEAIE